MRIGIYAKPHRTEFAGCLQEAVNWLKKHGCEPLIEEGVVRNFGLTGVTGVPREDIPERADSIVVFGGDGTILSVARLVQGRKAPILGVNMGSLGFLTEVTLAELYPALEELLAGRFRTQKRSMLKTEVHPVRGPASTHHTLNDVVINKGALARIIGLEVFISSNFVASFMADGLILATPTGSTAYSLSAGGPIVFPTLEAFIITPICPHTLTNRPLVIPADRVVRVRLSAGEDVMLTIDGQIGVEFQEGDEILCSLSEYSIELIQPTEKNFFDVLRAKLKWAER